MLEIVVAVIRPEAAVVEAEDIVDPVREAGYPRWFPKWR